MKVLATYNIKGGVGKTSTAVNLATLAREDGARVLLWDLDPQGAATFLFRIRPKVQGGGKAIVRERRTLADVARATDVPNLDLVPADFRYRHLDLVLDGIGKPTRRLARVIAPLADEYDWVFLDCAPSISLVSEGVFEAAHALLVPMVPSTLSRRTLDQLEAFISEDQEDALAPRCDLFAFFSMVDRRRRLHHEVIETLVAERPLNTATTHIPSASVVERMGSERAPLARFAPHSPAAQAYIELWAEVQARYGPP